MMGTTAAALASAGEASTADLMLWRASASLCSSSQAENWEGVRPLRDMGDCTSGGARDSRCTATHSAGIACAAVCDAA
eukprot:CAMPEP_0206147956 /NCGR_PEP_ID=MMETSP1473-20131121/35141_1 /ASSEMBLY_ACC=CAM_ASM_001109 /TAXON_ID=1461547 /ORGANISM="Stichococcus sp, Strain RCC1054" /LENGTH=77 /DNA_ID=CAMNT_0053545117 /DNA_START=334 /DNA_END=564 /DNA_ORIENTATION=+